MEILIYNIAFCEMASRDGMGAIFVVWLDVLVGWKRLCMWLGRCWSPAAFSAGTMEILIVKCSLLPVHEFP
jgi:hypothetical protein